MGLGPGCDRAEGRPVSKVAVAERIVPERHACVWCSWAPVAVVLAVLVVRRTLPWAFAGAVMAAS